MKPRERRETCEMDLFRPRLDQIINMNHELVQGHDDLKKALSERILDAELDEHLGQEARDGGGNRRNGTSKKTVLMGSSKLTISVPRDRSGSFDPKLIAKYQRRFPDFDEKIISMYARGGAFGPGVPGASGRELRHQGVARPDIGRDRCRS